MTPETFEAEFVAFNEFRKLCGVDPVPRVIFQGIVAHHNATIARKSPEDEAAWREMEAAAAQFDIDRQEPDETLPA